MKFIYLIDFAVLLIFALPARGIDFTDWSFSSANEGIQFSSSHLDGEKYINTSGLLNITAMRISNEPHKMEKAFIIGEVALSQAAKDLEKLSLEGEPFKLNETGEFTGLFSKMSSAFPKKKIPIKLAKFASQDKQLTIEMDYNLDKGLANVSVQESLEQTPPTLPEYEIFEGRKESGGGVDVIWDY